MKTISLAKRFRLGGGPAEMFTYKDQVTWTGWDAYDGVTHDGTYHYCCDGHYVKKFNSSGVLQATSPYEGENLGDICYYNAKIYVGVSTGVGTGYIWELNASDLSEVTTHDISDDLSVGQDVGIAYYDGYFWVEEGTAYDGENYCIIHKYDTSFVHQANYTLTGYYCGQGLDWDSDGYFYCNSLYTVSGDHNYSHIVKFSYNVETGFTYIAKQQLIPSGHIHSLWGGIGFEPDTDPELLWTTGSDHEHQGYRWEKN